MRAAIYTRISRDLTGEHAGVARQEVDCRALAERRSDTITAVYSDNDISAYSGKHRPGYAALLDAIEAGTIETVYVWHTDRLYRRTVDLERYIDICQPRSVATYAVQSGPLDLATPSGRMIARQLGAVAQYEVEQKSERQRRANLQLVQAGRIRSGGLCFGYKIGRSRTPIPEEAQAVRDIADRIAAGGSWGEAARTLNARNFTTRHGNPWTPLGVRQLLESPTLAGYVVYRGEIIRDERGTPVRGDWEPILSADVWHAIQTRLAAGTGRARYDQLLLSGVATCATCDGPVHSGGTHVKTPGKRYRCVHGCFSRLAEPVDTYVQEVIVARLTRPDARRALLPEPVDHSGTLARIAEMQTRLDELATAFADGQITASQLTAGSQRLRASITALEGKIPNTTPGGLVQVLSEKDIESAWWGCPLDVRREMIRTLVTVRLATRPGSHGTYIPGTRTPRPELIQIEWR